MVGELTAPGAIVLQSTVETATDIITQLLGLAILAGALAAIVALAYRWAARERAPRVLGLLVGLAGVAVYLNASATVGQVVFDSITPTEEALLNMVAFLFGAGGALAGRRAGDRFGTDVVLQQSSRQVEDGAGVVDHLGQVTTVELPEEVGDVVGYDPVPEATAEALAGKRFVFPGSITADELHDRLVSRIREDYAVGHVDLELNADGSVEHVGLGSRAAGIGPTLPPATNAVAVRADPAFSASPGDLVQVWETDPMRRVLTGELRGVADDVVTIAIDASDTPKVDPTREYRLVTLPVDDRPEREFASLLRAAPETFSSVTVEAGSPLHGMPVGALDVAAVAIKPEEAGSEPLPESSTLLAPGDTLFAIAPPEALRRLQTAAEPLDPSLVRDVGQPSVGTPDDATGPTPDAPDSGDVAEDIALNADSEPAADEADDIASADVSGVPGDGPAPGGAEATGDPDPAEGADGVTADAGDGIEAGTGEETSAEAGSSFDELKDEFDSGDADWDDGDGQVDEAVDPASADGAPAESDDDSGSETASFQDLKEDFDSGEADWDEDDSAGQEGLEDLDVQAEPETGESSMDDLDELEFEDDSGDGTGLGDESLDDPPIEEDDTGGTDDLSEVAFEEDSDDGDDLSDLTFEDDGDDGDDLSELSVDDDDGDDNLSDLAFEDDGDDPFDDDGIEGDDEETDDDEAGDDDEEEDEEDEDEDDGGGGGTSFAQLKEEFESGDADWEDDISDSPGGDMRLDE